MVHTNRLHKWITSIRICQRARALVFLPMLIFLLTPLSAEAWTTEAVDAPKLFSNFYSRAIAIDGSGNPHIAYGQDGLYHAYHDGSSWQYEIVDSSGGVGQFASIAIDSTGFLHVSYYDEINGDLKYATNASGSWVIEVADDELDVGQFSSIALDSSGKVHISYFDNSWSRPKYATNKTGSWVTSVVEPTQYTGRYSSLAVDSLGYAHISYYGGMSLKYATNASGSWVRTIVDSSVDVGLYTSIAADTSNKMHISYYDWDNGNLKYATNASGSWVPEMVDNGGGGGGDTGGYSSIAIDGTGIIHISYYDFKNELLKYATGTSGSWNNSTIDNSADVGGFTSIATDASNKAHVSYYNWDNGDIKYATNASGLWVSEIIDSYGDVGGYTSVATDASGYVYISYYDWLNYDLKYATNASGSWVTETVDNDVDVGEYSSIAIDSSGKAHISYYDYDNGELEYATNASGSWVITMVDNGGGGGDAGVYTDIAIDSVGNVHISYYDWKNGRLKHATNASGSWVPEIVDSNGDVGWYTSIAIGTSNTLHISYYDYDNGDLKYATGTWGSWSMETVDSTGDVGQDTSIAVDSSGNVHISYYDVTNGDLKYATGTFSSWTTITTLDSAEDTGWNTSIALDSADAVHISYYDNTQSPPPKQLNLRHITNASGSWVAETVDSPGDVGQYSSITIDTSDTIHISYYDNTNFDLKYANHSMAPPTFTLNVNKAGIGNGTVTSSPAGIDCGPDCTEDYASMTEVTLTPAPDSGSAFAGWSGDPDCSDGVVTMDAAKTCTATFNIQTVTLTVTKTGTGNGTVTSSPIGIDCGGDCSELYTYGIEVTLTPAPDTGSAFAGWSGDPDCSDGVVTMDAAMTCTASFTLNKYTLTTPLTPAGNGSVNPDCSGGCLYDYGTIVIINAIEDSGYPFIDWTDCDDPNGSICTMTMNADKGVTAEFDTCMYAVKRTSLGTDYYDDFIQDVYSSASNLDNMYTQDALFTENIDFNLPISVTLEGGYNCDYSGITGSTVINGNMTVSNGTVIIQGGTVEVQ